MWKGQLHCVGDSIDVDELVLELLDVGVADLARFSFADVYHFG